ncbi:RNA-binding S4 domain-containing protein [uncultured Enterovirga sp.]|uniref:RNA-binding S4 domain-containing protein n=1 Tax=uncultured Enterovirga sp. TaxID=2026352 RepID=UPI0035CC921B
MSEGRQRLDKWLWFARFAKTRTLASRLVTDGFVRVNGRRADAAAKPVGPGDILTIAPQHRTATVRILSSGERRGPATEAQGLYEDLGTRDDAALVTGAAGH